VEHLDYQIPVTQASTIRYPLPSGPRLLELDYQIPVTQSSGSTVRYPLLSQEKCEGDEDMHAANLLFSICYTLFAYNCLMIASDLHTTTRAT